MINNLPEWFNIIQQLQKITYESKKLNDKITELKTLSTPPSLPKKLFIWVRTTLIALIIVAPITYQLSSIYSSANAPISYDNIDYFESIGTEISPEGEIKGKVNSGTILNPVTNYNFSIGGEIKLYSGEIKDIYIIYNEKDDEESSLSPDNFHELKDKKNTGPSKMTIAQAFIPFKQILSEHVVYHKTDFALKNIHYQTSNKTLFYKPFYILTVDKKNNISIRLLLIKSKDGVMSISSYANFIYTPQTLQQSPDYKLFSLPNVLKLSSPEKSYNINKKSIEKSVNKIRSIANDFYI